MSATSRACPSAWASDAVVGQVGQVDLGRAAGALDDDELVLGAQAVEGVGHRRPQPLGAVPPGHRREVATGDAVDDDLAAVVGLWLEQHRVHADVGLDAGGDGLQPLGHADLAAGDDAGVVRHVLRLERHDVDALAGEPPHESRVTSRLLPALDVHPSTIRGRIASPHGDVDSRQVEQLGGRPATGSPSRPSSDPAGAHADGIR